MDTLIDQALLQEEIRAKNSSQAVIESEMWVPRQGKLGQNVDRGTIAWYTKFRKYFYSAMAVFTLSLSIYVLIG